MEGGDHLSEQLTKQDVSDVISHAIEPVVERLDRIDTRLDRMGNQIDRIETRLNRLEDSSYRAGFGGSSGLPMAAKTP
jgi:tetrahydromethanopterin S-methyltransferase subunit B